MTELLTAFTTVAAWFWKEIGLLLTWILDQPILLLSMSLFFIGAIVSVRGSGPGSRRCLMTDFLDLLFAVIVFPLDPSHLDFQNNPVMIVFTLCLIAIGLVGILRRLIWDLL